IAEQLGAQVWNTVLFGAFNFPNTHAQYRGELPGEHAAIRRALGKADVVLASGAELLDEVFYTADSPLPEGWALIQVDNAAWTIGKNITPTLSLLADPKLALQELSEVVIPSMSETAQQQAAQRRVALAVQKQYERERQERRIQEHWDTTPIAPARLMAALRV